MNWFVVATAVMYLGATGWAVYQGEWRMAVVWVCYAISGWVLAGLR